MLTCRVITDEKVFFTEIEDSGMFHMEKQFHSKQCHLSFSKVWLLWRTGERAALWSIAELTPHPWPFLQLKTLDWSKKTSASTFVNLQRLRSKRLEVAFPSVWGIDQTIREKICIIQSIKPQIHLAKLCRGHSVNYRRSLLSKHSQGHLRDVCR